MICCFSLSYLESFLGFLHERERKGERERESVRERERERKGESKREKEKENNRIISVIYTKVPAHLFLLYPLVHAASNLETFPCF